MKLQEMKKEWKIEKEKERMGDDMKKRENS